MTLDETIMRELKDLKTIDTRYRNEGTTNI